MLSANRGCDGNPVGPPCARCGASTSHGLCRNCQPRLFAATIEPEVDVTINLTTYEADLLTELAVAGHGWSLREGLQHAIRLMVDGAERPLTRENNFVAAAFGEESLCALERDPTDTVIPRRLYFRRRPACDSR